MSDAPTPTCRFCSVKATGRFMMDAGCVCFPEDRFQDLCAQHIIRATPLGSMELVEAYNAHIIGAVWPHE